MFPYSLTPLDEYEILYSVEDFATCRIFLFGESEDRKSSLAGHAVSCSFFTTVEVANQLLVQLFHVL